MEKEIGVIGLGKFGFYFAKTLAELGHRVMGIDKSGRRVQQARDLLTQVYQADAADREALTQMGVHELQYVLISVGDSIAASSMIAMYLKELGVANVWAKAVNGDHLKLLYKLGVDEVIIPEHLAAAQLATKVAIPGFLQYAAFDTEISFQELVVDRWAGKSLRDLDLSNRYGVQVIAVRPEGEGEYRFLPDPGRPLAKGDHLVVLRRTHDETRLAP